MWFVVLFQWLHVLLAIFWFGSVLYLNVILIPTILRLPIEQQRAVTIPLGAFSDRILTPVSMLVILFGILRGTVFGQVQHVTRLLGTSYGRIFLAAALLTIGLACWGTFVSGRAAKHLNTIPLVNGGPTPAFTNQLQRVKMFVLLELVGFFIIFTLMILLGSGI
ncbi:MAG: hypothetical protein H0X24_20090 [Ktedonobacterales bacterium]|nr:hypothetical protein [Ktedonobacterales bacterium]